MTTSVREKIALIPDYECSCKACRSMCRRPCFGTPEDISKLIDAGYGDRLSLESHCGVNEDNQIDFIAPALKGHESKVSPFAPGSEKGCTFWKYGKCELHNLGFKPTGGKKAIHDVSPESGDVISALVVETWNTEEGQALKDRWKNERGLLGFIEHHEANLEGVINDLPSLLRQYAQMKGTK
jgi:hypothetical protein